MNPHTLEAVERHRDSIEAWARSDLPLAEEMGQLLDEADAAEGVA